MCSARLVSMNPQGNKSLIFRILREEQPNRQSRSSAKKPISIQITKTLRPSYIEMQLGPGIATRSLNTYRTPQP